MARAEEEVGRGRWDSDEALAHGSEEVHAAPLLH